MSNHNVSEDIIGIVSGIIGYCLSKLSFGIKLFIIADFLPEIHAIISSVITAFVCAVAGFIATRICHFIWVKIKSKIKNEKDLK